MLPTMLDWNMKLPFIAGVVAVDGGVQAYRFPGPGVAPELLADHSEPGDHMVLPIKS